MAEPATKLEVKTGQPAPKPASAPSHRREPFESLRREVDRIFDSFGDGFWRRPFARPAVDLEPSWPRKVTWDLSPAMDVAETEKEYEITTELPGLDDSDIEVSLSNGSLTIRGEKREEKEEKKKDYYLCERRYGAFQRSFHVPEGVDADKIQAMFKKGLLTVVLPKTAEARKSKKKIAVKVG